MEISKIGDKKAQRTHTGQMSLNAPVNKVCVGSIVPETEEELCPIIFVSRPESGKLPAIHKRTHSWFCVPLDISNPRFSR